ncbi:STAS domain-containing protein [Saccharomonospora iraqiensis]|uniref:STAS domain-containing protein n=1 Tax=Saccharomonospora iraqiensis TaxID=52698 RepID=UPI000407A75A|nr:STAS domain-containing protein [Saccharomonospora iraqiensis]
MDREVRTGADIRIEAPVAGTAVVRVSGEVDLAGALLLRRCLDDLPGDVRGVVLDLSGVVFFGAAGLSALGHVAATAARRGLRRALVCPSVVLRPMRMTDLDVGMPVCADRAEALAVITGVGGRLAPSS